MFFDNNQVRFSLVACLLSLGTLAATEQATAAELDLADSPLYLSTSAQPNILFIIDDSGSMDWEIMSLDFSNNLVFTGSQRNGSSPGGSGGVQHRDSDGDGDVDCAFNSNSVGGYLYGVEFGNNTFGDDGSDCNTADDRAWRFRNHDFNPLYFNPDRSYKPWAGLNANGLPFVDIPITNALAKIGRASCRERV